MEELYSKDSILVCKLIYPESFGALTLNDLEKTQTNKIVMKSMRQVIESSLKKEGSWTKEVAAILLNSYRNKYLNQNIELKEILKAPSENKKEIIANGTINMYKYFMSQKPEEATLLFRAILTGLEL